MTGATREIRLDELPRHSPWPARLLGLAPAREEARTPAKVLREYDRDKYAPLLAAIERDPRLGLEDVKRLELGDPAAPVVMSIGDRLVLTGAAESVRRSTEAFVRHAGPHLQGAASVVDLGCGYGYGLAHLGAAYPGPALRGGEYAPSAVALAHRLHRSDGRIRVTGFDFNAGACRPLEEAPGPAVVVLAYAIDQLPTAAVAVDLLAAHRDRIVRVVCFDAERRAQDDGLLGLLRRRYVELNRYSWDLLDVLEARDDVVVDAFEADVVGANALLPASLVVWHFA